MDQRQGEVKPVNGRRKQVDLDERMEDQRLGEVGHHGDGKCRVYQV